LEVVMAGATDFEAVALPHMADLYRTASRVLGDRSRADDVVQETYLHAWKAFHRFETGTNCRAWLFRILFNCIHHHRRKWFRGSAGEAMLELLHAPPDPLPEALTDREVLSALDRIPPDYRAVALLCDVEEFQYKEAAAILSIPIGTVMSRLSRARRLLRVELAGAAASMGIGKA
jgi:RNA polymerase sigma-70 factor (ECF subfamily)